MLKIRYVRLALFTLVMLVFLSNGLISQKVAAQDTTCPTGFSAKDCTLLAAMALNMGVPQQFNVNYDLSLKTSGSQKNGNVTLSAKGAGLASTAGITQLTIPDIMQGMQLATTMQLAVTGVPNLNVNGQVDLRLVDGTLYFQSAKLNKNQGWLTVSLSSLMGSLGQSSDLSQFVDAFNPANAQQLCACITDVLQGKSQAGPKIDGKSSKQMTVVFDLSAAYAKITNEQEKRLFLTQYLAGLTKSPRAANLDDPAQLAAALKMIRGTSFQYSWFVTPDDQMYHGFAFKLSIYIDPLFTNAGYAGSVQSLTQVNAQGTVILSKIGRTVNIPAGTGKIVDITDQLTQAFSSSR
ncbi:MAG: hypothetical protein ABI947_17530 [Chloroflexota bacterium]